MTGGEHVSALAAVRALRAAGYAPWVTVHERGTYAARSRATAGVIELPTPWEDESGFVGSLVEAARDVGAAAILPGTEFAMATLARNADRIPADVVLGMGTPSALEEATDKGRLAIHARRAGLEVPPTAVIDLSTADDPLPFPFPVVAKPQRSEFHGEDGVVRHYGALHVTSADALRRAVASFPGGRGLVQPFLPGPMWSLAGVYWHGRMVAAIQARGDRIWPPLCGSISHGETVELDASLSEAVGRLLRSVCWDGLFQVDLFGRPGGYLVTDLNPRIYTSLGHATHAGLNLPAIWVDLLLGREPAVPASYRLGVHYRHDEGDLRAVAHLLLRGPRGAGLRGLIPSGDTALAVFSPNDPAPLLTSLSRLARRRSRLREAMGPVGPSLSTPDPTGRSWSTGQPPGSHADAVSPPS